MAGAVIKSFEEKVLDFEKALDTIIILSIKRFGFVKKQEQNMQRIQQALIAFYTAIAVNVSEAKKAAAGTKPPSYPIFSDVVEKIRKKYKAYICEGQLKNYERVFDDLQARYMIYQRQLETAELTHDYDPLVSQHISTLYAAHAARTKLGAATAFHGGGGAAAAADDHFGTVDEQVKFTAQITSWSDEQKKRASQSLTQFTTFFAAATTTSAQCAAALAYLQSEAGIESLASEDGYKEFLKQNAIALYHQIMWPSEVSAPAAAAGGGGSPAAGETAAIASDANPIHGVVAAGWYHNKASDRDMILSGLWDEVIRYSTGVTADAERQRELAVGAAQVLNELGAGASLAVPLSFAELLRIAIAGKADGVKGIVIDREGEVVADAHPELHARFDALSEDDLTNICRNLNRMQQDMREENASQPFRQAFTLVFLALPSSIEKLTRINGYERYKVRESKAETLYEAYRRILNPPSTDTLPPRFFDTLTHLETGSLLEQNGTLRQLDINLRQFAIFLQKETTPEDQRYFVQEYLQRETVISTLAQSSSFADFQAALLVRPTAPPKSAMRPEPAAVFAPAPAEAASAPPLPQKGGFSEQGPFSIAAALAIPEAPTDALPAAAAPALPVGVKHEAVKEPVLG